MYSAEQAAPVSLHQLLWLSVGPVKPPDTLPLPSPQEKPDPRGVSLRLSSPLPTNKPHDERGQLNSCRPHVWLKSAPSTTFMTVVFYRLCPTGRGNLVK